MQKHTFTIPVEVTVDGNGELPQEFAQALSFVLTEQSGGRPTFPRELLGLAVRAVVEAAISTAARIEATDIYPEDWSQRAKLVAQIERKARFAAAVVDSDACVLSLASNEC